MARQSVGTQADCREGKYAALFFLCAAVICAIGKERAYERHPSSREGTHTKAQVLTSPVDLLLPTQCLPQSCLVIPRFAPSPGPSVSPPRGLSSDDGPLQDELKLELEAFSETF